MFLKAMQNRVVIQDDIYVIPDSEHDADFYDDSNICEWRKSAFDRAWTSPTLLRNDIYKELVMHVLSTEKPVVDIASGPSMGFIPALKGLKPDLQCLALDASKVLMREWKKYFERHATLPYVELAQFSLFDIPFRDESVDIYASYLGLGSTRKDSEGYEKALSELYRTLKPDGRIFAVEGEWIDKNAFLELFAKAGREPWQCFKEAQQSWQERFEAHGFEIVSSEVAKEHYFEDDKDFELSSIAKELNIKIGITYKTYILKKH